MSNSQSTFISNMLVSENVCISLRRMQHNDKITLLRLKWELWKYWKVAFGKIEWKSTISYSHLSNSMNKPFLIWWWWWGRMRRWNLAFLAQPDLLSCWSMWITQTQHNSSLQIRIYLYPKQNSSLEYLRFTIIKNIGYKQNPDRWPSSSS
jgi:hypothetical protein